MCFVMLAWYTGITGQNRPGPLIDDFPQRAGLAGANVREKFRGLSSHKQMLSPSTPKIFAVHKISGERFPIVAPVLRHARLKRRVKAWSWALNDFMQDRHAKFMRLVMITLTLRDERRVIDEHGEVTVEPAVEWYPEMMSEFIEHFVGVDNIDIRGYAWVCELTKAGRPHFHVLLLVRAGSVIPKPDSENDTQLAAWWPHGSSQIVTARSHWYIVKYVSKGHFVGSDGEWKKYPKGMRIFAVWVAPSVISPEARWWFRLSSRPGWLRELLAEVFPLAEWEQPSWGGWRIWPPGDAPFLVNTPYWIDGLQQSGHV